MNLKKLKPKVHQFHYWAAGADAITQQMQFIQNSLKSAGLGGEIFAVSLKEDAPKHVLQWDATKIGPDDLLLIHHSQGNPILETLLALPAKKGLVYHNITPPQFFTHDPHIAEICQLGRDQLPLFSHAVDFSFAVSDYNAKELLPLQLKAERLPLFDFAALSKSFGKNKRHSTRSRLIFVGRLSPHKNQAAIIEILYYLSKLRPEAELVLVGSGDPVYSLYLKGLAQALGLEDYVRFYTSLSDLERNHLYQSSDAFICLSQHEGFCIPIVEAMAAGIPVISTTHAALAETLGEAGVKLKTENPLEVAALMDAILSDADALSKILKTQRRRLAEIAKAQSAKQCVKAILALTTAGGRPKPSLPESKPPAKTKAKSKTKPIKSSRKKHASKKSVKRTR